jgi:hypothetical protein
MHAWRKSGPIAAGLVAVVSSAACAPATKLSGAEIVAKNVTARGGLQAWRRVETMVWIGRIESTHAPLPSMGFTLEQKRPNKTRLEINTPGEKSVRAFDGVQGWKRRGQRGGPDVQPYTPQELRSAQAAHGIDGALIDSAAKGNSVTLESVDEIDGRRAYHLSLRATEGGNEEVWVDARTFLEIRYDRIADGPAGAPRRVSATYDDYRTVEGLQIPFVIETGRGSGSTPDRMQIERVVLNAPLDDSTFENPAVPHPRNRGRPSVTPRTAADTAPGSARQ